VSPVGDEERRARVAQVVEPEPGGEGHGVLVALLGGLRGRGCGSLDRGAVVATGEVPMVDPLTFG
jgi:hypothetical protein